MAGDKEEASAVRVPVVDVRALMGCKDAAEVAAVLRDSANSGGMGETLEALRAALTEWGFFYISNHGIAPAHMADFQRMVALFFALPKETKATIRRTETNPFGYYDEEFTKNKKDWKEIFSFTPRYDSSDIYTQDSTRSRDVKNQWLNDHELPGFKRTLTDYYYRVEHIAQRLLMLIAVTLGEDVDFFDQFFYSKGKDATTGVSHTDNNTSSMRLNHYPIAPEPEKTMGVHHHTDPGALTVLLQDDQVASLQVFHRGTQQWQFVPPVKDTFVINIGDMIQVWSNDKYAAPMHRVLANSSTSRYSAPFFHNPGFDTNVQPLLVDANDTPKYREVNWKSYIMEKVKGDFANLEEEDPHISQYRIQEGEAV